MKFRSKNTFELLEPGSYTAALAGLIDLGTQEGTYGMKPKCRFTWEILDEETSGGHPFVVHTEYTVSTHAKSRMLPDLETLLGRKLTSDEMRDGVDAQQLLGKICQLEIEIIEKDDRQFAGVKSVSSVPRRVKVGKPVLKPVFLSLSVGEFCQETFDGLNERTQRRIMDSPEWGQLMNPPEPSAKSLGAPAQRPTISEELNDNLPF